MSNYSLSEKPLASQGNAQGFYVPYYVLEKIRLKASSALAGNMKPSDETIEKFRRIYFEEFGEEISKKEAYDNFISPVDLLRVILRSVKKQGQDYKNPGSVSHGEQYPSILFQFLNLLAWMPCPSLDGIR